MFNEQFLFDRKMTARFDKAPGPTPEELAQLPSRLPEGLGGVGMGLGSGGNPLTEVAKNLPGSTPAAGNTMSAQPEVAANSGGSGLNVMDVVRTLQVAKQLDMMGGGGGLGNLTGALSNLSGGNGGMSNNMGNNMMAPAGGMGPPSNMGAGVMGSSSMGSSSMGAGPMGGSNPMGGSSMSGGPSMNAGAMGSSMGGMSRGPSMSEYDRPSMGDMGSRNAPSGYSSSTAPSGPSGGPSSGYGRDGPSGGPSSGYGRESNQGPSSGYGRGGMSDSPQMSSSRPFDTIIIRNLPLDCNWQVLREGFSHCGDIKYAEMKEQGSGLIRFANERDAERAISMMHKQTVAGRVIDVRPY